MTKAQLNRKADQLINLGMRLEDIIHTLPHELRDTGSLKSELARLVSRISQAARG